MLDVNDFIKERGGDPEKIRESQRKRYANVEIVDEVIADWEDHRKSELQDSRALCFPWPSDVVFANMCAVSLSSSLRRDAAQQQDQRGPEADRSQEEGQGRRDGPAQAKDRPREGEEGADGERG